MDTSDNKEGAGNVVTRGVAISGGGNLLLRVFDALTAILLFRWLSIFEYGVYRLVVASYEIFSGFFLSGLENVVVSDVSRSIGGREREAKVLFSVYFLFSLLVGAALWAVFFFGGSVVAERFLGGGSVAYLRLVSFFFFLAPLETAMKLRFQIFLDFGWTVVFKILSSVTRLVALIIFFFYFSFGVREVLLSVVFAMGVPIAAVLLGYRREMLLVFPSFGETRAAIASLFFRHGKWAIASDFINNISQNIRPFVIKAFVGTEAVALIALAQNLVSYTKSLLPIREILTPVLPRSADDPARLAAQINRATKYATYAYVGLGVASAIGSPVLVYLLFPKYLPALPFFYLFLLGLPFFGFRSVAVPVFYALKAQQLLVIITSVRTAALAVLTVILTYFFGIWGAAMEMLLMGIITTPAYARAIGRALPQWRFSVRELFRFDREDGAFIRMLVERGRALFGLTSLNK